jgi:hypothetical protein
MVENGLDVGPPISTTQIPAGGRRGCMRFTSNKRPQRKFSSSLADRSTSQISRRSLHCPPLSSALASRSQCVRRATSSLLFHRANAQENVKQCYSVESFYRITRGSRQGQGRPRKRIFESGLPLNADEKERGLLRLLLLAELVTIIIKSKRQTKQ